MVEKMAGQYYRPLSYGQLITRFRQLIQNYADRYVFIESGMHRGDQTKEMLELVVRNTSSPVLGGWRTF